MIDTLTADPSIAALRALRDSLLERLMRESEDFRKLRALEQAIALFDRGVAPMDLAVETTGLPLPRRRGRKALDIALQNDAGRPRRYVSQREAAERALLARGEPLTIKELLVEVVANGATVGGVRPQATLSSNLSQDPRFVLVQTDGRLCWWLGDRPIPAAPQAPVENSAQPVSESDA